MATIAEKSSECRSELWRGLPARIKVLYITTLNRDSAWLDAAFATDSAVEIVLEEAIGATAGLARLRDEVFDALLVSHEPGVLDALELIEGLRGGGNDEPLIVLGHEVARDVEALCYEVGADAYCPVEETTTRALLWRFAQAIGRHQLTRENRRLVHAERQRLHQEHQEAERLLSQQRLLIGELESISTSDEAPTAGARAILGDPRTLAEQQAGGHAASLVSATAAPRSLPDSLVAHYRELLRAYVIMGAGNLTDEMTALATLLADANVSAQQTMQMHVYVLEELIRGLGNRSARHVMNRADLLVLEVMVHLADSYREQSLQRRKPWRQLALPGCEDFLTLRFSDSE